MTNGVLSIQSIGFYVAIGCILLMVVQGWGVKAQTIENISAVMAHKAKVMQDQVSRMAADAKRASVPDQWFYAEGKERRGPFSIDQLKQMVGFGQLKPTTMIWRTGMASWMAAAQVSELFPSTVTDEPPPVPV
jgi:hypothetical protein